MRKLIALLLVLCLALTACAALGEIEIREFPAVPEEYAAAVDPANPLKTIYSGAFAVKVPISEGVEKDAVVYLAEDFHQTQGFVMIVPDSGMSAAQVLEEGGWKAVADSYGLYLMILEPKGEAVDAAFLNAATSLADTRNYWRQPEGRNYIAAYGDSADAALLFTESYLPSVYAGIALFGDLTVQADAVENKAGIELPAWFFVTAYDGEEEVVNLLRSYNGCTDEVFSNASADMIWFPNQQNVDLLLNDQPMSQVRVTIAEDAAALNADRADKVYDFFKLATREVGYGPKAIRYTHELSDWGLETRTMEVGGVTRTYFQYVPTVARETAEGKIPLMLAIHGAALNGEYFAERTSYVKLAEEFGFAIVFPTGSVTKGIAPAWSLDLEGDDVKFIKEMIDKVCQELPIDESRIYCYGHSNGGMFTQVLVRALDGRFAAAAGTGCAISMVPEVEAAHVTPMSVYMGEFDLFGTTFASDPVQYYVSLFKKYNHARDEYTSYRTGRFENYVWTDEAGVPVVRLAIVDEMPHTATLDLGMFMFDFLSQYSRGEDGSVVWQGGIYNAK